MPLNISVVRALLISLKPDDIPWLYELIVKSKWVYVDAFLEDDDFILKVLQTNQLLLFYK